VHVDPFQAMAAWAYGLAWQPVPIFQTYAAYTPELDEANAIALTAPEGPERILRGLVAFRNRVIAIDGRNHMFESPLYMMTMLCNFRELHTNDAWEVLGRTENRCGSPRLLSRSATSTRYASAPSVGKQEILIARIEIHQPWSRSVLALAFKTTSSFIEIRIGERWVRYRLVNATAGGPLVLCLPDSAGFDARFVETRCPTAIRLVNAEATRISFYGVPLTP